jgi:hypothetical protein
MEQEKEEKGQHLHPRIGDQTGVNQSKAFEELRDQMATPEGLVPTRADARK